VKNTEVPYANLEKEDLAADTHRKSREPSMKKNEDLS